MFKKFKSLFSKEKCFCDQCSDSIIDHCRMRKNKKNLKNHPQQYTDKEWEEILNKIIHALDKARDEKYFISTGRKRILMKQIQEGFDLLRLHYKDL